MNFETLYMMQVFMIICLVFSVIAYVSLIRAGSLEELGRRFAASSCIMARQYVKNLNIEDCVAFEKYGIWRYSGRFWKI